MDAMQQSLLQRLGNGGGNATGGQLPNGNSATQPAVQWRVWYHPLKGKFLSVPPDFDFPKTLTAKPCWDLYLHGIRHQQIRPFRLLKCEDLPNASDTWRLSAMKSLCKFVLEHVEPVANVAGITEAESDRLFESAWPRMAARLELGPERDAFIRGDLLYTTIYVHVVRKFQRSLHAN